jgi:putative FmdB family regulatory protein
MPLYEYQCDACAHRFEVIQKFSDAPVDVCPKCGGAVKKLLSSPAIQFKGTGWYITDYARSGKTDSGSAPASSEGKTETKPDPKTETKSEPAKTDSKGTP